MASQRLYLVYRPQPSTNARIQRLSEQLEQDGHTLIAAPPDSPPDSPELREALAGVDAALLVLLDAEAYASLSRADVRIIREAGTRILCLTTLELATEQALASAAGITPVLLLNDDWDDLWDKLESRLSGPLSGQVPPPAPVEQPARSSGEDDSLLDHLRDFLDDFDVPAFLRRRTERKTPSVDVDISDPKAGPGAERGTWIPELDEVKRTRERPTTKVLESWDASAEDDETWADDPDMPETSGAEPPEEADLTQRKQAAPEAEEPEPIPKMAEPEPLEVPRMAERTEAEPDEIPRMAESADESPDVGAASGVLFSAYHPTEVKPDDWQPLIAYILKESAADAVLADAAEQLGDHADIRETTAPALQPVAEDALVTAVPSIPGFEFDPPQASGRFRRDWRRFDFEFRAVDAPLNTGADGRITFLVEGVIVADVPLSIYVSPTAGQRLTQPKQTTAKPYPAIFCSYSHKDTTIVEKVEKASRYFNFRYLRDVHALRSGEQWNQRLLEMIDEADIFQLFWSRNAAASQYVAQEYRHAAALKASGRKDAYFIRPIRWEEPMPAPAPPELDALHFDLIEDLAI